MALKYYKSKNVNLTGISAATVIWNTTNFPEPILNSGIPDTVELQAQLPTNPTFLVYFALDRTPTALDNDGMLVHGGSAHVIPDGANIQFLVTNAAGAATVGGALDNILLRGSIGRQVS